jgi:ATP-dependent helicase/nuclease subunit A
VSTPSDMVLSSIQKAAVFDPGERVLVSAGAGSGKTRLLVACFIRALVDEGIPPDCLIAVTFTRKAAAELVDRIRQRLQDQGRPDLALSLDAATIGTIHSLCAGLLRESALEAGVDPAFSVLEAEAATLAKHQVRDEVWNQAVEEADEADLDVLGSHGLLLQEELVPLYERLRVAGIERPQVAVAPGVPPETARVTLTETVREALRAGLALTRRSASLEADLAILEGCLSWIEGPGPTLDLENGLRQTEGFFPSRKTSALEPHFEPLRAALTHYRRSLAEQLLRPVVVTMNGLLVRFHRAYQAYKRERGLLDFTDLELYAQALLVARRGGPAVAGGPGLRVMVDEFQDTNELQCSILEGLEASRLLMVGDARQSIYRFRGADVEVFRRRETALGPANSVHRLDVNYRSRREILSFINRLFADGRFFGSGFAALAHGRDERCPGDHGRAERPVTVEVLAVERLEKPRPEARSPLMQEAEAHAVAAHVRRLMDEEHWEPRQIAVLTPAQTHVDLYQEALIGRGVEVYVVGGKGYYGKDEIADMTALLSLLINPHNDLSLVTVLRSPVVGLSDDGLYLLGREAHRRRVRSLWEVVREGVFPGVAETDLELLLDFVTRLNILRRRVGRPGLARLIDDAVSDCGYDVCLLASPQGKRRFANVRKLMRLADDYEALEGPDLAGFVRAIGSMGDLSDREGSAPTLAEGENVVRVMTVHQAKGLEFPVVVLAGLGSDVPQGSRPRFIVGSDGRMGVFLKGSGRKTYEAGELSWGPAAEIADEERAKEREEDVRLLYVAMTRAEERLVLVGAKPLNGGMEGCRIGRIIAAMGFDTLPEAGSTLTVEGLDAIVTGVAVSAELQSRVLGLGHQVPDGPHTPQDACPSFLEWPPRSVTPRQISFSALAAYQRCPRQFYLERVLAVHLEPAGVPLAPRSRPGPIADDEDGGPGAVPAYEDLIDEAETRSGRVVGLLVHALLERHALEDACPPPDLLHDEAVDLSAHEASSDSSLSVLSEADLERAVLLTGAFWHSPFAGDQALFSSTRETPFVFAVGDIIVSGVMDLVWQRDGAWHIVDYKTNALRGRTPVEAATGYELQGAVYALAALRAGAESARMDFLFLEQPNAPVALSFDRGDELRLRSLLERELDRMRSGDFTAKPGEECPRCPVAALCSEMAGPEAHGIQ